MKAGPMKEIFFVFGKFSLSKHSFILISQFVYFLDMNSGQQITILKTLAPAGQHLLVRSLPHLSEITLGSGCGSEEGRTSVLRDLIQALGRNSQQTHRKCDNITVPPNRQPRVVVSYKEYHRTRGHTHNAVPF